MKKLLLIILILLPCELGAQEGCGWWFETKGCLNIQHMLEDVDSVWVPKSCVDVQRDSILNMIEDMLWAGVRDSVRQRQMTVEEKLDTLYTDWMYADSIYVFFLGKRFIWIREGK